MCCVEFVDGRVEEFDVLFVNLTRFGTCETSVFFEDGSEAPVLEAAEASDDGSGAVGSFVAVDVDWVVSRVGDYLESFDHLFAGNHCKRLFVTSHRDGDQLDPIFVEELCIARWVVLRANKKHGFESEVPEKREIAEIWVGTAVYTFGDK